MSIDRRNFLKTFGAGLTALSLSDSFLKNSTVFAGSGGTGVGMCDWNIGESATAEVIPLAKQTGIQGIQVSVGTSPTNIPLRSAAVRKKYLELGKQYGIVFHSVAAGGILNDIPLASEPQSAVYVIDALEAAKALGAKNILIAFFGNGDLRLRNSEGKFLKSQEGQFTTYEIDTRAFTRVIEALRQIVPRAEDLGVALGIENTLTTKQNLEIIDQIGSTIAQVYYDVGNSWGNGYDVAGELKLLGNDRICEIHLKDWQTEMLGSPEGQVNMAQCAQALKEIGYNKWLVLETSGRKDRFVEDTQTNVTFVKKTFSIA